MANQVRNRVRLARSRLKFGLPFVCVGVVSTVALLSYSGAVQDKAVAAASVADRFIPVTALSRVGSRARTSCVMLTEPTAECR
jgi:hypothetical protein